MYELNWNIFKTKFDGKEQKAFEALCYHLFRREFNKDRGIFRFKNQTGVETEPIEHEGKFIAFQAKYYETKLSDNKADIIDSITKAKGKNPALNKIVVYTNQEFSESSKPDKKKADYQTEIEEEAQSLNVEIEWRVRSHFEAQLSLEINKSLATYFFSLDKSPLDLIDELTQHTEAILTPIRSRIEFKGSIIKLDRSQSNQELEAALIKSPIVILSGEAGVGKTAVIKDLYDSVGRSNPFFVFKASEFNISHVNELFARYGAFTFLDFIKELETSDTKYIIIDSAEKISDIEHQDVFLEFISTLLSNKWKIIFTTRFSYLEELKFQFVEVFRIGFYTALIHPLTDVELAQLSIAYKFNLPAQSRLFELLCNPFYLDKYLQVYGTLDLKATASEFKALLWNNLIVKSSFRKDNIHRQREDCFLAIARKRAVEGFFFVSAEGCNDGSLQALAADDIIGYDQSTAGYFVTQDIYEEWALDTLIERGYQHADRHNAFFQTIGSALPIRRAFRLWLFEKLLLSPETVKSFITDAVSDQTIPTYWKDELYISILRSDHAALFFQLFEDMLLETNLELLKRIIFLLRVACKGIDDTVLEMFGLHRIPRLMLNVLFTMPQGSGWECIIQFIYTHRADIGLGHIHIILPLLNDWTSKNKTGETTRAASLAALYYYNQLAGHGTYGYGNRRDDNMLINVILQGASTITKDLENIFDAILAGKSTSPHEQYYDIVESVLTSMVNGPEVAKYLPAHVIKLADLFWFKGCDDRDYHYSSMRVEHSFGLAEKHDFDYFPSSAYQTPILWLLGSTLQPTIDFILAFVNKTALCANRSDFKDEFEEIVLSLSETQSVKQLIGDRIWNIYRGTYVSPHLLESMHMALEKWLLQYVKTASARDLEKQCLHLLKNSYSASITAVVASAVLSQPAKLFSIAKILFRTKALFFYDKTRWLLDQTHKDRLTALHNYFHSNYQNKYFENERIEACDDNHRKSSLEDLMFYYQVVRFDNENDEEVAARRRDIREILDQHYRALPDESSETEEDKTWRLFLARMDGRKMSSEMTEKDGQTFVSFKPDIEPELKKFSEESQQEYSELTKYSALRLWAHYRFEGKPEEYQKYSQYEADIQLAVSEAREIMESLKKPAEERHVLFNGSIPAYVCAVLIRDFADTLGDGGKKFCRETITQFAALPLHVQYYSYQVDDGTKPAIFELPLLLRYFPDLNDEISPLLLLLVCSPDPHIATFATSAVVYYLWDSSPADAQSIFLGYLLLKPKYDLLREELRKENFGKEIYEHSESDLVSRFIEQYAAELEKVAANTIRYEELPDVGAIDLATLKTAFELLPGNSENEDHKKFLTAILPIFSRKLLAGSRKEKEKEKIDHELWHRFWEKLAYFILNLPQDDIKTYLQPFVDDANASQEMSDLLAEFITTEDRLNKYEEFWIVWQEFYDRIVEVGTTAGKGHYAKYVLRNYLLAYPWWKEDAKEWHSLKDRERAFYQRAVKDMGDNVSVFYSIAKILNDIGSVFIEDGIVWLDSMVQKMNQQPGVELESDTLYYVENIMRRYILLHRHKVKTSPRIKGMVLGILGYLIERGSITGYLLREDIL